MQLHPTQIKILSLARSRNIAALKLREIGELVGVPHPQIVKHHMLQLQKRGLLVIDKKVAITNPISSENSDDILTLPILGAANCGLPTALAEENLEGYLKISPRIVNRTNSQNLFVLKASGVSMNRSNIDGQNIEDGDYVIIDGSSKSLTSGRKNYMVAVIEGCANIKKVIDNTAEGQIILVSESTEEFAPIYLHPEDNFMFNGRVIKVVKKPRE